MSDWDIIVDMFWRKYHWDADEMDILHNGTRSIVRKSIAKPTMDRTAWTIVLRHRHFDTKDEAMKYAMGLAVLEDLLEKILKEQQPPEEPD